MSYANALNSGYGAYDDGEPLTANPFDPYEEKGYWQAWRTGWINAEADARREPDEGD